MHLASSPFPRSLLALALLGAAVLPLQAVAAGAVTDAVAQPAARQSYDLPAGPLDDTLSRIARQAGITLSATPGLLAGRQAAAVRGEFTAAEALQQALAGSGLEPVMLPGGAWSLRPVPVQARDTVLPEVSVTANRAGATEDSETYALAVTSTATKMALSARQTPQSVSVVTHQMLEDQNIGKVSDALRLTTGVSTASPGPAHSESQVRGFSLNTLQIDGHAFTKVTGYDSYFFDTFNTASFDHIEVVRGATGLSSGSGSPAGSINVVRKRPTREFRGNLRGTVGNYESYGTELDVSGPLAEGGDVRGRLVAGFDDQQDHIQGHYSKSRPVLYGVVDADLGERTQLSFALDWQEVDGKGLAGYDPMPAFYDNGTLFLPGRSLNLSPAWEQSDQMQQAATLGLTQQLDEDWQLKAAYVYRQTDIAYKFLANYSLQPNGDLLETYADRFEYADDRQLVDVHASGNITLGGRRHQLVLGYTQSWQDAESKAYWPMAGMPLVNIHTFDPAAYAEPVWELGQVTGYDVRQSALYGSTRWQLAAPLSLLLGTRISNYRQDETVLYRSYSFTAPFGRADYNHRNVVTPYAGLVYDLTANASLYASYTDIFNIQNGSVRDVNRNLLDPIEGVNLEAGGKAEFFDKQLMASVAFFRVKQENLAVVDGQFTDPQDIARFGQDYYRAEGGAVTEGYELEVAGSPLDNWQLMAGFTHQKPRSATGQVGAWLPGDIFKLSTRYQFGESLPALSMGGVVKWQGKTEVGPYTWANNAYNRQSSYALLDAWAGWRFTERLSSRLNVSNLTDKVYRANMNGYLNYGEARRIALSLNWAL